MSDVERNSAANALFVCFHGNSGYANAPQFEHLYIHSLPCLLNTPTRSARNVFNSFAVTKLVALPQFSNN
jgi:hypothetical protein